MDERDSTKPITAEQFTALCGRARVQAKGTDECSLLYSLCQVLIDDLSDPELVCPPASEGAISLMDAILCDYLVYRYERESSFDPFPIIQSRLFSGSS
jgi:hypothetical protein